MSEIPGGFSVKDFVAIPRRDLCEPAFRKYERLIAKGIMESFVIDPRSVGERLSARTFVARFNDAKRGYMLYGYKSEWIPRNYNVGFVKAVVGANDMVLVYSSLGQTKESIMNEIRMPEVEKLDTPTLRAAEESLKGVDMTLEPVEVHMENVDAGETKRLLAENPDFFGKGLIMLYYDNETQKQEAKGIKGESLRITCVPTKKYKDVD